MDASSWWRARENSECTWLRDTPSSDGDLGDIEAVQHLDDDVAFGGD